MLSIADIAGIIQAQYLRCHNPQIRIQHLLTDSRQLTFTDNTLFFALTGASHDGHTFIQPLVNKGVKNFVISQPDALQHIGTEDLNVLYVVNTLHALQALAKAHRQRFQYPVIGITGSNGKTIVKEWLAELLSGHFHVVKSPKSYNSQVGVPLSIWQMTDKHEVAIIEAGISKPQEMQRLQAIIQPNLGIFTNIGEAHDEGFENRNQKIQEKYQLFTATLHIFSVNTTILAQKLPKIYCNFEVLAKHKNLNAPLPLSLEIAYKGSTYTLQLPFADDASVENILSCLCVVLHLGISLPDIQAKIIQLKPVPMRLQAKPALQGCNLIDDSYNNDLAGLKIALDFLATQPKKPQKNIIILSDILESGETEANLYAQVAQLLQAYSPYFLIGIGESISRFTHFFPTDSYFFTNTDAFEKSGITKHFYQANILLKGARKFHFEQVAQTLIAKQHRTTFEIDLNAIVHNLNVHRHLLKPQTRLMAMVKAWAYGNGLKEIAALLQYHLIDYLAVAYTDEGVELRQNYIQLPIMVLNVQEEDFANILQYNLEPIIYNFTLWEKWLAFIAQNRQNNKKYPLHIEIDTGMHRLGFTYKDIDLLCQHIQKIPNYIHIQSVFSHLASAEEATQDDFTRQQIALFEQITQQIRTHVPYPFLKHIANSAATLRFPEAHFDMVRLGVSLYGIATHPQLRAKLQNVGTLKTIIAQVKTLKKGETIGYNQKGKMLQDGRIGIISIGYADGFSRSLSNGKGKVWIKGKLAPVIGNVCMDMTMIDLSQLPDAQEGDEVIIFSKDYPIENIAQAMNTIPYEVLTSIGQRVKRVFYME